MLVLDKVVYVFRHKNTQGIVAVWGDEFQKYKQDSEYNHVATLDPLAWIKHYWRRCDEGTGTVYMFRALKGHVVAIDEDHYEDYCGDPEWEEVEVIDDYIDWIEKHYNKSEGKDEA